MKFLRLTEEDGSVIYIPINLIREITVEENEICVIYGENNFVYPIESETEIAKQINQ